MADFENQDGESHRLSLRDSLMSAVEQHREESDDNANTATANVGTVQSTDEDSAAAAQRARDEAGRFKRTDGQAAATATTDKVGSAANAGSNGNSAPETISNPTPPPSSWKKDYHESFAKLDPTLQKYILQRETEFNTGVSTYRGEAESARTIKTALEPFLPNMQRYNVKPEDWIKTVGQVHETLLGGSPQQKLQTILGLARDYQVDLAPIRGQQASAEGEQQPGGQLNPEVAWLRDQVQQLSGQVNSFTQAQQKAQQDALLQQQTAVQTEIQQFSADTAKYPHFEALRETMAGLLQSGLAQDLSSAYDKAIRMNDDLWQAQQAQQTTQAEAERKRAAANVAASARQKVASVKSATPSSAAATASTAKDRRSQLAEAVSSVGGSRV